MSIASSIPRLCFVALAVSLTAPSLARASSADRCLAVAESHDWLPSFDLDQHLVEQAAAKATVDQLHYAHHDPRWPVRLCSDDACREYARSA